MSTELHRERCVACRRDAPAVTDEEVLELKPRIPDWEIVRVEGVPRLHREFRFDDFRTALSFTLSLGELAEREGHHPLIVTEYGRVSVEWWTHKIRNLHRNDFIMAAKTDALLEQTNP